MHTGYPGGLLVFFLIRAMVHNCMHMHMHMKKTFSQYIVPGMHTRYPGTRVWHMLTVCYVCYKNVHCNIVVNIAFAAYPCIFCDYECRGLAPVPQPFSGWSGAVLLAVIAPTSHVLLHEGSDACRLQPHNRPPVCLELHLA